MVHVVVGGHRLTRLRTCDMITSTVPAVIVAHLNMSIVALGQSQSSMSGLNV